MIRDSENVLKPAWDMNEKAFAEAIEKTREHLTSNLSYNNEQSLQSAIPMFFDSDAVMGELLDERIKAADSSDTESVLWYFWPPRRMPWFKTVFASF